MGRRRAGLVGTAKDGAVGRDLRTLFNVGAIRNLTDGQLLERFATGRGEGGELAFAALVERHGPMVLRVARGVLGDPHEAQDAFQATFLVLVAKGRRLWVRDSLAPWLHQVAYRTASCQRANLARRRRLERRASPGEAATGPTPVDDRARVLLEEVERLPERYRAAVVLCDLEGRTHEQAARSLGWPVGTVKSRQSRGRQKLRDRLTRRGVAPGLGLGLPALDVPLTAALVDSTTLAAVRFVISRAIAPGTAAALAQEVIRAMTILRWTKLATPLLALGVAASGAGLVAQERGEKAGETQAPGPKAPAAPAADPSVVEVKPGKLTWNLSDRGNLEPSKAIDVLCEVEGNTVIIKILPDGAAVKRGDVVAELDSATLRDTVVNQRITTQQAEAAFKQARLVREVAVFAVKEYVEGVHPQDREALMGKVVMAKSAIEKGQARLERTRLARQRFDEAEARRTGPPTPADVVADLTLADRLEAAELDIQRAKVDLEAAQTQQQVLEKHTLEKRTQSLKADVGRASADELAKQSRWELERTKERKLMWQIERCTLKAPGDGVVVYANEPRPAGPQRVQIEEGATVRERQKLFSIIDLAGPVRVNAKLPEATIDRVQLGQSVRIKVDAIPNEEFAGTVLSVAPMADPTVFADDRKVYTTLISVEKGPRNLPLRPGMSASVEMTLGEVDHALQVPVSSLFLMDDDTWNVLVKAPGGRVEPRKLTLGMANDQAAEVKEGLKAGDLVVRDPLSQLPPDLKEKMQSHRVRRKAASVPPDSPR